MSAREIVAELVDAIPDTAVALDANGRPVVNAASVASVAVDDVDEWIARGIVSAADAVMAAVRGSKVAR